MTARETKENPIRFGDRIYVRGIVGYIENVERCRHGFLWLTLLDEVAWRYASIVFIGEIMCSPDEIRRLS